MKSQIKFITVKSKLSRDNPSDSFYTNKSIARAFGYKHDKCFDSLLKDVYGYERKKHTRETGHQHD